MVEWVPFLWILLRISLIDGNDEVIGYCISIMVNKVTGSYGYSRISFVKAVPKLYYIEARFIESLAEEFSLHQKGSGKFVGVITD